MSDEKQAVILSPSAAIHAVQNGRPIGDVLFSGQMQLAPVAVQDVVLEEYDKRRTNFMKWLLSHMKEGVHYGIPPGCEQRGVDPKKWTQKATLYKAGAQLCIDLLQLQDTYAMDRDIWEAMGQPKGCACFVCTLSRRSTGEILATGHGSMEGGEKRMNVNSRVKIAKKRAQVDAVILAIPGLADLFTQDMDDGSPAQVSQPPPHEPPTENQIARLRSLAGDQRLTSERRDKIGEYLQANEWTKSSANKFIFRVKQEIVAGTGSDYVPWEDLTEGEQQEHVRMISEDKREPGWEG